MVNRKLDVAAELVNRKLGVAAELVNWKLGFELVNQLQQLRYKQFIRVYLSIISEYALRN